MKKIFSGLLLALSATVGWSAAAEAGTFYVSTARGELGTIDDTTGQYTRLYSTPRFTDIALDPNGNLWGIDFYSLYSVDLNTGITRYVGELGDSLNGLGFSTDGSLYGTGRNKFYSLDLNTGRASTLASIFAFASSGDIVFDAARDLFWATSSSSIGDILLTIARDGTSTRIGSIGFRNVYGLAFDDRGTLLGYTDNGVQLALDLNTGAGTALRNISGLNGYIWGAASKPDATAPKPVSTPEPSAIAGLIVLSALLRRKQVKV
ncbi:hypothetical protein [Oscillatoria sp. FACHB-1406]|uniref:hypothetical protein n=1 Tax=Oscillatoria sp. FACHB-1406 TaxID=2692846 RepID=UPI001687D036|nr:hypothetical protein [Oscillatoria sp. FACHB-1406]MBD2579912.1 hypothetical protein [Oscillatoria sp. FACHB-1406]